MCVMMPMQDKDTYTLNVSGKLFTIRRGLLQRYPETRLAELTLESEEYDCEEKEFYFDRNPKMMQCILDLYRTDELHLPRNICSTSVKRELDFWGIPEDRISECCWKSFSTYLQDKQVQKIIEDTFQEDRDEIVSKTLTKKQMIWLTMDDPQYSMCARMSGQAIEKYTLNVSGKYFTIRRSLLKKYPGTRLANLTTSSDEYDCRNDEFYFDRNPKMMQSVLDMYRTDELHLPLTMCSISVKKELDFWGFDELMISDCCWKSFSTYRQDKLIQAILQESFKQNPDDLNEKSLSVKRIIWMTMDNPQYSTLARRLFPSDFRSWPLFYMA